MNTKIRLIAATILVLCWPVLLAAANTSTKPNILFIFADDWGWGDLSSHGHPYVQTPNIDRLIEEGTDFHRFTVASGVCSPSRTAVMTGQFPGRYNIDGHFAWVHQNASRNMPDWLDPDTVLLPRLLQQAGYATAHYGKWHLANDMIPDSPLPIVYGYDDYGAFNCAGIQMPVWDDAKNTIAFMRKAKKQGKPFFVNVWLHEPHTPHHTLPKYRWPYRDLEEPDEIYASIIAHADDRVGDILNALDKLDLTDNTLVIFSSDNGPARAAGPAKLETYRDSASGVGYNTAASKGITGGRKGYKASLFEGGIGVPFIARWPGKIASGKVDAVSLMSAVDLLPTFCEIAGAELPDGYKPDGVSQVKTLMGKKYPSRTKPLYWYYNSPWPARSSKPDHWVSYAVVHKNWKLVTNKKGDYVELYDIAKDVYEKNDLKEMKPEVVQELHKMLTVWQDSLPEGPDSKLFSSLREK
ncbi:MAG: sulfatase [Puniceicoccaceae bacterium]